MPNATAVVSVVSSGQTVARYLATLPVGVVLPCVCIFPLVSRLSAGAIWLFCDRRGRFVACVGVGAATNRSLE